MTVAQIVQEKIAENPNLVHSGTYRIDGRRVAIIQDRTGIQICVAYESKDDVEAEQTAHYTCYDNLADFFDSWGLDESTNQQHSAPRIA